MFDDPDGLDVDAAWGPYATRDAIKRGDWRKIDRLRYDSYAESKFRDLERLYNGYDSRNWWTRNVWDAQGASQQLGSIANREADLNRIIKEGPWAVKHDESVKAHTLQVAMQTHLPTVAAGLGGVTMVQSAFSNANAVIQGSHLAAQYAKSSASLAFGAATAAPAEAEESILPSLGPGAASEYDPAFLGEGAEVGAVRVRGNLGRDQGREFRVDQLMTYEFDPDQPSHVRGWLKQERRLIEQGRLDSPRTPPGYVQAHGRTTPAREGFDYSNSRLQLEELNKLEEGVRRHHEAALLQD
jgi:hypothetical protein